VLSSGKLLDREKSCRSLDEGLIEKKIFRNDDQGRLGIFPKNSKSMSVV
jgi:hypothetical protein